MKSTKINCLLLCVFSMLVLSSCTYYKAKNLRPANRDDSFITLKKIHLLSHPYLVVHFNGEVFHLDKYQTEYGSEMNKLNNVASISGTKNEVDKKYIDFDVNLNTLNSHRFRRRDEKFATNQIHIYVDRLIYLENSKVSILASNFKKVKVFKLDKERTLFVNVGIPVMTGVAVMCGVIWMAVSEVRSNLGFFR